MVGILLATESGVARTLIFDRLDPIFTAMTKSTVMVSYVSQLDESGRTYSTYPLKHPFPKHATSDTVFKIRTMATRLQLGM